MRTKKVEIENKKGFMPGFEVVGQSFSDLGNSFVLDKNTYYTLQNYTEPSAYKDKIVYWIGKNGFYLEKDGEFFEDKKILSEIYDIFKDNTWSTLKDKYFTNHFCSGDIYMYPRTMADGSITCQIVDSRTVVKKVDIFGNITGYTQYAGTKSKDIPADKLYNSIVRYNPQNPNYGKSLYYGIVYDALSDSESSKRQFNFFKNNSIPNALFILDPNLAKNKEQRDAIKQQVEEKFRGSENAHKIMIAGGITDVKLLELSNKDLDLLGLRNFVVRKRGICFQIDPRIIGFMSDSGADRSITSVREEAKETIQALAMQFEGDINNFYREFINPKADFTIKLDSEQFVDRENIQENQRKDLQLGITTINEVRAERDLELYTEPEANKPIISSSMTFLDQLANQFTP